MSDQSDLSKPLKTWSHLAGKRRRPSEYEIVSTNLLWSTDDEMRTWALSPDIDMNKWYLRYRNNSPLKHDDRDGTPSATPTRWSIATSGLRASSCIASAEPPGPELGDDVLRCGLHRRGFEQGRAAVEQRLGES